MTVIHSNW